MSKSLFFFSGKLRKTKSTQRYSFPASRQLQGVIKAAFAEDASFKTEIFSVPNENGRNGKAKRINKSGKMEESRKKKYTCI